MGPRVLLVEGQDDQHVMWGIFAAHNVPDMFRVEKAGGIDPLLESIPVWLKASNLERFAVILDADEDLQSRWQQVKQRLLDAGCAGIPETPGDTGTVVQVPDGPKAGVWIMP